MYPLILLTTFDIYVSREGSVGDEAHEEAGQSGGGHLGAVEDDAAEGAGAGRAEASDYGTRSHRTP